MSEMLHAEGVTVDYRDRQTLRDVSLTVGAGEILGVVGRSGAGKSILVRALINLVPPPGKLVDGEIRAFGTDLRAIGEAEARSLRGARIGVIVQNPRGHLNPLLRVGTQISNVYRAHHDATKAEARERAISVLRDVGIPAPEHRYAAYPHELSGGMAQRAMIAMALVCDPELLIADEPTSGLDVTIQDQILKLFRRSVDERRTGGLLVTRDMGIVARFCDRVAVLHEGEIVEQAAVPAFFSDAVHPVSTRLIASASFAADAPGPAEVAQ
ncbi:MAG TPA: ABC transporter ATP-binding protein [Solirubrobacter sp.]|nr:ABC transporter ATP-binding protein [Solirubrobacter sp.]